MAKTVLRLKETFQQKIAITGLTDEAVSRMIGIPQEQYASIKNGDMGASAEVISAFLLTGLATSLDEVAEAAPAPRKVAA